MLGSQDRQSHPHTHPSWVAPSRGQPAAWGAGSCSHLAGFLGCQDGSLRPGCPLPSPTGPRAPPPRPAWCPPCCWPCSELWPPSPWSHRGPPGKGRSTHLRGRLRPRTKDSGPRPQGQPCFPPLGPRDPADARASLTWPGQRAKNASRIRRLCWPWLSKPLPKTVLWLPGL